MKTICIVMTALAVVAFGGTNEVAEAQATNTVHVCRHGCAHGRAFRKGDGKVVVTDKARQIMEARRKDAPKRELTVAERKGLIEKYRKIAAEKKAKKGDK